jgi:DNA-binding NtrC family response regulator
MVGRRPFLDTTGKSGIGFFMDVLVVEDERLTRRLIEQRLESMGHQVTGCEDAESAWEAYQSRSFPLLILDWMLPGMDGLELCRKIRELPLGDRSMILVATSRVGEEHLQTVLASGADDYLTKPVDWGLFEIRIKIAEQRVRDLLERKRVEGQVADMLGELEKSRNDLLSILNQLRVGAALTDAEGVVTFLSETARSMFFGDEERTQVGAGGASFGEGGDVLGRPWTEVFPFNVEDLALLRRMSEAVPAERSRVSAQLDALDGRRHWVDVDIQDDPGDPQRKIFFYYDVTEVYDLRRLLNEKSQFHDLVGKSKPMLQIYEQTRELSKVDLTVLIEGETGSGKELVARAIHFSSHRAGKPFLAVNCAGLTESLVGSQLFGHKRGSFTGAVEDHKGLLEAASGGTLLLDEIGDIPVGIQASLLRVLQEKEVTRLGETQPRKIDVRILAATHRDLVVEVEEGRFRQDLLYRLRIARIDLPPVRQRREDIPLLVASFLRECRATTGKEVEDISQEAMGALLAYHWPGNVRELKSAVEYAVMRAAQDIIQPRDLPPEIVAKQHPAYQREDVPASGPTMFDIVDTAVPDGGVGLPPFGGDEKQQLLAALRSARGNRTAAARLLGVSRATFYRRLSTLGIDLDR